MLQYTFFEFSKGNIDKQYCSKNIDEFSGLNVAH